jgi:glycosyltransferase involved in cell wall biosynthesis
LQSSAICDREISMTRISPRLLVFSSLFPSRAQPGAGVFIRERMFRVGKYVPLVVLAPQAWFPGQSLIRRFRPHFRPLAQRHEVMSGVEVYRPRYLSVPGLFKGLDGLSMALCSWATARRLVREHRLNVLDAHFAYPDGRAAAFLKRRLALPMVLTLRGKESRDARGRLRPQLVEAIGSADHVITVSNALRDVALELGATAATTTVVGNGIDVGKFRPLPQPEARARLELPSDAQVIVSVGTLVERKGFQRIIEVMPRLLRSHAKLHLLIAGGAGAEGDDSERFRAQVRKLGIVDRVRFLGPVAPELLRVPLSAADLFVLASSYEGWANVLLEAMACGLPVVATDVGGNSQVVCEARLGELVPFGDSIALADAVDRALRQNWDRAAIRAYAMENDWDLRMPRLIEIFNSVLAEATDHASSEIGMRRRSGHVGVPVRHRQLSVGADLPPRHPGARCAATL